MKNLRWEVANANSERHSWKPVTRCCGHGEITPRVAGAHHCRMRSSLWLQMLLLLHTCSAMHVAVAGGRLAAAAAATRCSAARMLDASLAADTVVSGSSALPTYVFHNPHTLDNLLPDMFNTAMVAGLGLMGAYVTQV